METANIDIEKLRLQLEYYLSDSNLVTDAFFHSAISAAEDGFIPITLFLKCNRVTRMAADLPALRLAIGASTALELSPDGESVRRAGALPPPPPRAVLAVVGPGEELPVGVPAFRPALYAFTAAGRPPAVAEARRLIARALGLPVVFARVSRDGGEFVVEEGSRVTEGALRAGRARLSVRALDAAATVAWLARHRPALELALRGAARPGPVGPVALADRTFASADRLRDELKAVLARTPDGALLEGPDADLALGLLAHHEDPARAVGAVAVAVGAHPQYPATRCFFAVAADGTRTDFSLHRCLRGLHSQTKLA